LLPELKVVPNCSPVKKYKDPLPPEFARGISEVFLSNPLQDEDLLDDFKEILSLLDNPDSSNIGGDIRIYGDMVEPYN
jgi:hypothetical protein